METEIVLNVKVQALDEGGFLATSPDLPGLVVQGRTRVEAIELAQANARILIGGVSLRKTAAAARIAPSFQTQDQVPQPAATCFDARAGMSRVPAAPRE
jgi:predicted RNase H-like HicB family nuclease